jgi:hypothetical protein
MDLASAEIGYVYNVEGKDIMGKTGQNWACKTKFSSKITASNWADYWDPIGGAYTFTSKDATLSWNSLVEIAEIGGEKIKVKLPANPNTDKKVTAVGNHYTPSADTNSKLDKDASSTSLATPGTTAVVTGVTISRDAAGHVTDLSLDSIKLPARTKHEVNSGKKADGTTDIIGTESDDTLVLGDSGVTKGEYGPTSNQTPEYGSTFKVPDIKVNEKGIVTSVTNRTVKIPDSDNTDEKVKQTVSTTNGDFPLLLRGTSAGTSTITDGTSFGTKVKANPSTGVVTTEEVAVGGGSVTMKYDSDKKALKFVF